MSADRFRLIENYTIGYAGGSCYFCKTTKRAGEQVVDTGTEIDGEGWLAICGSCARELGTIVGMVMESDLGEALIDMEALEAKIETLTAELEHREELKTLLKQSLEVVG